MQTNYYIGGGDMMLDISDLHSIGINDHEEEVLKHVAKIITSTNLPDETKLELILASIYYKKQWSWVHVHP